MTRNRTVATMRLLRLRKLFRLPLAEKLDLLSAQWALVWAQFLVWTRPTGRLLAPGNSLLPPDIGADSQAAARHLGLAVSRAAHHGIFRPACLVRAVALQRMLEARRIHGSRIRIGVRRHDGRFAAHAWVEYGDLLLGDQESHVRTFTSLTDIQLAPPR